MSNPQKQLVKLNSVDSVVITKWKVDEGTIVYDGRVLAIYNEKTNGKTCKLKSKHVGTVSKLFVQEGDVVNPGDSLLEIDIGCSHPTVINDLCAECGADLQKDGQTEAQATIPMVHSIPQLKVSHEQAQRIGRADTERLLKDRKLVLLVDLDQTLIHTTHDNIPSNLKDVHHFQLYGSQVSWYHTRLRPGTKHFLEEMSKYYELHICTFGVRPYAHMVAHILDKDAKLFSNRILSRDECFDYNSKFANLHALFPCGDELVCIIDDREDVWNYSPNLIQVKPYQFFRNTGDIHDPNLPPAVRSSNYLAKGAKIKQVAEDDKEEDSYKPEEELSQNNSDETKQDEESPKESKESSKTSEETESKNKEDESSQDDSKANEPVDNGKSKPKPKRSEKPSEDLIEVEEEDDYLKYLEDILIKVHTLFYQIIDKKVEGEADVKWVISELRKSVLKGCELVLSGLVPLGQEGGEENSEPARMAQRLGATVVPDFTPSTTHLVAATTGTVKVHRASRMKGQSIKIVNPYWLITCSHRWERVDESLFTLTDIESRRELPFRNSGIQRAMEPSGDFDLISKSEMDRMKEEVDEEEDDDDDDDEDSVAKESDRDSLAEEDLKSTHEDSDAHEMSDYGDDDSREMDEDADWSQMAEQLERGLEEDSQQN